MPRVDPCPKCGKTEIYPHLEDSCRLELAIQASDCPYCLASAGEPCVSAYGKIQPQYHIGRVGLGHRLLVKNGTPGKASELIVAHNRNKGQTFQHLLKRRREA